MGQDIVDGLHQVLLAEPRGFCAGVDRAIDIVERALAKFGAPIYVRHEIVHNTFVVNDLKAKGAIFIEDLADVPPGATLVFSAHGVPPSFHEAARDRGLNILDTTCKFVYDIHREAKQALDAGYHLVFIGDPKHREVIGYTNDLDPASYHIVSTAVEAQAIDWSAYPKIKIFYQTTLNAEEFEDVVRRIEATKP